MLIRGTKVSTRAGHEANGKDISYQSKNGFLNIRLTVTADLTRQTTVNQLVDATHVGICVGNLLGSARELSFVGQHVAQEGILQCPNVKRRAMSVVWCGVV